MRSPAKSIFGQNIEDASMMMQLLHAVGTVKQKCTTSKGLDHTLLARLLTEAGFCIRIQAPHIQCKCKSQSRKCLEKLAHTYLVCIGTARDPGMKVRSLT